MSDIREHEPAPQNLCGGHPGRDPEPRRSRLPGGRSLWLCRHCWARPGTVAPGGAPRLVLRSVVTAGPS